MLCWPVRCTSDPEVDAMPADVENPVVDAVAAAEVSAAVEETYDDI